MMLLVCFFAATVKYLLNTRLDRQLQAVEHSGEKAEMLWVS